MKHVSPSQIEKWLGCPRQWYWEYPMGFKPPSSAGQLTGTACHTIEENVILGTEDCTPKGDGKDRYRAIVRPALPTLLKLRAKVVAGTAVVESEAKRMLRNGLAMVMRIDIMDLDPTLPEPSVVDHKNMKDFTFVKTEEELRTNIQMLAYAYEATCRSKVVPLTGVRVAHSVCQTQGFPTHRYTDVVIPIQEVHAGWRRIQDISDKMLATGAIASPADVPEDRSSCGKFRGCAHLDRCRALWAAKSGSSASTSPYAGLDAAPASSPTVQEIPPMPDLDPRLVAKLGVKPAGLLPPEAPQNPRDRRAEAASIAASKTVAVVAPPPPVVAVEVTAETVALVASLGWTGDEIDAMTDDCFADVARTKTQRETVDAVLGPAEDDGFRPLTGYTSKVVAPPVAPVRRSRVAAAAAPPVAERDMSRAAVEARLADERTGVADSADLAAAQGFIAEDKAKESARVAAELPGGPEAPRKRVGRPPGSTKAALQAKADAALDAAKTASGLTPAPAADPVAAALAEEPDLAARRAWLDAQEAALREDAAAAANHDPAAGDRVYAFLEQARARIAELEAEIEQRKAYIQGREKTLGEMEEQTRKAELRAHDAEMKARGILPAGFTLYIDCLPEKSGVPFRALDDVLAPLMLRVAANWKNEKTGAPEPLTHYALVPFARGPGMVAAYVLTNLDKVVQPGILYVDTRSPCAAAVLEVLRPKADAIVSARGR